MSWYEILVDRCLVKIMGSLARRRQLSSMVNKTKKLLFISNIAGNAGIGSFACAAVYAAKECGAEFHVAKNYSSVKPEVLQRDQQEYGVYLHHVDFYRNPFSPHNIKAFKQVVSLIEKEKIDVIHCNTPIGGVIGRLAGKRCGIKHIIYQAHGFHFYDGAPILNWMIYYPAEKYLARYTDALITINNEDFNRAQSFKLREHGRVYFVPGVGIDTTKYKPHDFQRDQKRKELGLSPRDIAVISVGDLIERKNYKVSIEAIQKAQNAHIQYYICGEGPLKHELLKLVDSKGLEGNVHFLGYRSDIKELLWASDIYLFTTHQEGLPRSLSEAMAAGLPCIASNIRGNNDLMKNGVNGYLFQSNDVDGFANALRLLCNNTELRRKMSIENINRITEFSMEAVVKAIVNVYKSEF